MRRRSFIGLGLAATIVATRAQQPGKVYRIAIVHPSSPVTLMNETGESPHYEALFGELRRLGYIEAQNLVVERYSGQGWAERYAELARDAVHSNPDLIYAIPTRLVQHLKAATTTIPILAFMSDPVAFGFDFSRSP